jgi:Tol biopolymer transport system component
MRDDDRTPPAPRSGAPLDDRLDSWKEIAAYLGRGIRTVQRWEREEGLPVHRLAHEKRGSIYARREELAAWWESRRLTLTRSGAEEGVAPMAPRLKRVTSTSAMTNWPALSSDARLVAYVSDGGHDGTTPQIWIQQIGGASLRLTNGEREYSHLSFSPENTSVLFTATSESGPSVYEVPALGGEPRLLQRDAGRGAISPDGRWLACAPRDGTGIRLTARGGAGFRRAALELVEVACVIWMPDSRAVLVHARPHPSHEPDWWAVPINGSSAINTGIVQLFRETGLFTIPTGAAWIGHSLVVSGAGLGGVCLYRQRVTTSSYQPVGQPERLTAGSDTAWLPSAAGGRLAFLSSRADANLWSVSLDAVRGVAGGPLRRMTRGPHPLGYLSVTGNFRTLAYFSYRLGYGEIFLRDLRTGTERILSEAPAGEKGYPAISPAGDVLAYGLRLPGGERALRPIVLARLRDGTSRTLGDDCGGRPREWMDERRLIIERFARLNSIALIDTETGDQQEVLVSDQRSVRNPRLSPDRRWIAFDASRPGEPSEVAVAPFRGEAIPESAWTIVDRPASHPFWSADGRFLYYTPAGTNPLIRSAIRARHFDTATGLREDDPIAVYASNEMVMPAYLAGTAPLATPDEIILVLGDFRGDIWLMELAPDSTSTPA